MQEITVGKTAVSLASHTETQTLHDKVEARSRILARTQELNSRPAREEAELGCGDDGMK